MRPLHQRGLASLVFAITISASSANAAPASAPKPAGKDATTAASSIGAEIVQFQGEATSRDARDTANWVTTSHDNRGLPFIVIDKVNAKVLAFDGKGSLRGASPALLGLARSDASVPGIGHRKLATITPAERTTPAGRFQASLGNDFDQDILWVDYDAALSLHRVIAGRPQDHRAARLASASPDDNRISYGCINVPAKFYDDVVKPLFTETVGIVYILPETKPLRSVFAVPD